MKLSEEFDGYVIAKVSKVYNSSYNIKELLDQLNKTNSIIMNVFVSNNKTIGGNKYIYITYNNISVKTIYDDYDDLYESTDDKYKCVFMIKIESIL
jgi:hypothetical protein